MRIPDRAELRLALGAGMPPRAGGSRRSGVGLGAACLRGVGDRRWRQVAGLCRGVPAASVIVPGCGRARGAVGEWHRAYARSADMFGC